MLLPSSLPSLRHVCDERGDLPAGPRGVAPGRAGGCRAPPLRAGAAARRTVCLQPAGSHAQTDGGAGRGPGLGVRSRYTDTQTHRHRHTHTHTHTHTDQTLVVPLLLLLLLLIPTDRVPGRSCWSCWWSNMKRQHGSAMLLCV